MTRDDTDECVTFLNSLAKIDPVAMGALVAARVPCSRLLADHPSVQVAAGSDGVTTVGILGVINGYCGVIEGGKFDGWGPVMAVLEEDGSVTAFRRTDSDAK